MDNASDTRATRNRWQRLLKGRQKQKVDAIENVAKYDKNAVLMLHIMWVIICWDKKQVIMHAKNFLKMLAVYPILDISFLY